MAAAQFTIRRKVFTIAGASFHIYDANNNLIGFCRQKAFKLKEDIRVYTDESKADERLLIQARAIIDFSAGYDIIDPTSNTKLGAMKRRGMKSIVKDEWIVMDEQDQEIGRITEDSTAMALLRRFASNLIPQKFYFQDLEKQRHAELRTHFNPFIHRMTVTVYESFPFHPMLILGAGILMMAIEGRQA